MMFIIFCIVEEVDRSVDLHLTAVGSLRKFSCEEVGEGGHLGGRVAGRQVGQGGHWEIARDGSDNFARALARPPSR